MPLSATQRTVFEEIQSRYLSAGGTDPSLLAGVMSELSLVSQILSEGGLTNGATEATLIAIQNQLTNVLTRLTEIRDRLPNTTSPVTVTPAFLVRDNTSGSSAMTGTIPSGKKFINWVCITGSVTVNGAIFQAGMGDNKTYERESGIIYPAVSYSVAVGGNAFFSYAPA